MSCLIFFLFLFTLWWIVYPTCMFFVWNVHITSWNISPLYYCRCFIDVRGMYSGYMGMENPSFCIDVFLFNWHWKFPSISIAMAMFVKRRGHRKFAKVRRKIRETIPRKLWVARPRVFPINLLWCPKQCFSIFMWRNISMNLWYYDIYIYTMLIMCMFVACF